MKWQLQNQLFFFSEEKVEDVYKFSIGEAQQGIHFFNKGKRYIKKISKKSRNALQKSFVIYAFFHCFERKKRCYPQFMEEL